MANMTFKASLLPSTDNTYSLGSNDIDIKRWKINGFAGQPIEYIEGTQAAATGSWIGVTQDSELKEGKVIAYRLPYAGSGNASLTLTFTNPTGDANSGAIPVYAGNTRLTTHYPANSIMIMVYDGLNWRTNPYYNTNTNTLLRTYTGSANYEYPLLAQNSAANATAAWTEYTSSYKDYYGVIPNSSATRATINLSTGHITVPGGITANLTGTASKATADADGNNIKNTYATKASIEALDVNSPNSSGSALQFIDTISQTNGKISATKKQVQDASASQSGVVNTTTQTFAGSKTFNDTLNIGTTTQGAVPTVGIHVHDIRATDFTPGSLTNRGVNFYFTNTATPNPSWTAGIYVRGWQGSNYAAWCLTGPATDGDQSTQPLYVRTSKNATTWGNYRKIYDTSNKPTPSEILGESDTTKFYRGDQSWSNEISGGIFKVTNNENTVSIGSQNESYAHFTNSANIPFYFNKEIHLEGDLIPYGNSNSKNLGRSSERWQKLYIGTADSYGSTAQPIYWNAGAPTAITYTANRLYYPSAVNAFTAGTHFVSDTKIAINNTSNPSETLYVNGMTKVADGTDATSNSAAALVVTGGLAVGKKANIGTLDGGQHIINGNVQLNAQSGSYNEGLRINRSTTGYANIYLGGSRNSASGAETGGWWIGTRSVPNDATSTGDSITDTVFTISNHSTSDTLSIKGTRGATIGTNSGWAIRPRLAIGTTYQTGYNLYVNGTSYHKGNDTHAGNINPEATNTRSLGISETRWKSLFIGTADSYGSTSQPIYWNAGVPATCNIISSGNYKNGFATIFDGNGYGEIACGLDWHKPTSTNDFDLRLHIEETHNGLGIVAGSGFNSAFTATNFYGTFNGNASTAAKLQTARNIAITGAVTGNANFDGSGNISISTAVNHSHNWLDLAPGNKTASTGAAQSDDTGPFSVRWYSTANLVAQQPSQYGFMITCATGKGSAEMHQLFLEQCDGHIYHRGTNGSNNTSPPLFKLLWQKGDAVTGAVWNDYAEYRESHDTEFGYVVQEVGDDTLQKTSKRLDHFAGVTSDTWGFAQGETEKAKTPIAVAGRVLVYPGEDRNKYQPGDCVCAGPDGRVYIMTREEIREWPDRIVGIVSCVPNYEEWGGGEIADRLSVKVNGRIWIKVK